MCLASGNNVLLPGDPEVPRNRIVPAAFAHFLDHPASWLPLQPPTPLESSLVLSFHMLTGLWMLYYAIKLNFSVSCTNLCSGLSVFISLRIKPKFLSVCALIQEMIHFSRHHVQYLLDTALLMLKFVLSCKVPVLEPNPAIQLWVFFEKAWTWSSRHPLCTYVSVVTLRENPSAI